MPWTEKQQRFFQAVAHGMKPRSGKLSKATAQKLAGEGVRAEGLKEHLAGMISKGKVKRSKKKRKVPSRQEATVRASAGPAGGSY